MALGLIAIIALGSGLVSQPRARQSDRCADQPVAGGRDPANPLALPVAPGSDPLQGAHFFVDGPRHGAAAGAIAQMLGIDPQSYPDDYSWAQFKHDLTLGALSRKIAAHGSLARRVRLLSRIADQQETQNISLYAQGGGPGAIFAQTQKIICNNMQADQTPATVPVLSTFLIYPHGQFCPSRRQIEQWQGTFKRLVDEMAAAIGHARAVILEEIDSLGASSCLHGASLRLWLSDLRYESMTFGRLPHAVTYAEAGYSDSQGPRVTAQELWQAGVSYVRGFFTDDTHFAWAQDEIRWGNQISGFIWKLSKHRFRAHFVVNSAQNGRGPKLNPHPVQQGIEDLCNPTGRGLGRIPTGRTHPTFDGHTFPLLDAFLWTGVPGRSHNSNCPNGPWQSAGVFDARFALELAQNANQQLGPRYPSLPYP